VNLGGFHDLGWLSSGSYVCPETDRVVSGFSLLSSRPNTLIAVAIMVCVEGPAVVPSIPSQHTASTTCGKGTSFTRANQRTSMKAGFSP